MSANAGPERGRPLMARQQPEYGIPASEEGLLPWGHVAERLELARNYWLATTRPDGRPHVAPVWGAWVDGRLYFGTSPGSIKGRNLASNPAVAVHLENAEDVVVLEGTAEKVGELDPASFSRLAAAFAAKYAEPLEDTSSLYVVRPRTVLAWAPFPHTATRWDFR